MRTLKFISIIVIALFCLSGCAESQNVQQCVIGDTYGFWGGLWHGMIAPFSFIASLFIKGIEVWAVNNTGGWYTFGFILGVGALAGGSSSSRN